MDFEKFTHESCQQLKEFQVNVERQNQEMMQYLQNLQLDHNATGPCDDGPLNKRPRCPAMKRNNHRVKKPENLMVRSSHIPSPHLINTP